MAIRWQNKTTAGESDAAAVTFFQEAQRLVMSIKAYRRTPIRQGETKRRAELAISDDSYTLNSTDHCELCPLTWNTIPYF
jgi:hypothetical protein